jgi:hypothetical protein
MQDSTGDGVLLEGERMEQGEGEEEESPFSQLARAGVIPETPTSSQDCYEREEESVEEIEDEQNRDNSVASSTIVISPDTLEGSSAAAACNDGDSMSIGRSPTPHTRNEECVYIAADNTQQPIELNNELAGSAMGDYLSLETGLIGGYQEGEPLQVDEIIGGSGGEEEEGDIGEEEEEGSAIGVEGVEVKQELLEEEETEPQARPCIQILDSLGIKRPSTARRIRKWVTLQHYLHCCFIIV